MNISFLNNFYVPTVYVLIFCRKENDEKAQAVHRMLGEIDPLERPFNSHFCDKILKKSYRQKRKLPGP